MRNDSLALTVVDGMLRWYFSHFPIERGKWMVWERLRSFLETGSAEEIETTVKFGMRMKLTRAQYIDRFIYYWSCFEPNETWVVQRLLKAGDTFVDAGANIGHFTLLASSIVGDAGRVISFEPVPDLCRRLKHNVEINGLTNVEAIQAAVSDKSETTRMGKSSTGGSATYTMRIRKTMMDVYTVRTVRLDDVLGTVPVQFIKLDVEGAEVKAIKGCMKVLESAAVPNLFVEVSDVSFREMGSSCDELYKIMCGLGYTAYGCRNRRFFQLTLADLQSIDENKVLFSTMSL